MGNGRVGAGAQVICQVLSWFYFFAGVRTLANSLEMLLVTAILSLLDWPGTERRPKWCAS